ncbi:MAG: chorismate-binding protein [Desulfobacterales bacterium]|nr:chorismate-binding protein [Desulfobacterales bacterium]
MFLNKFPNKEQFIQYSQNNTVIPVCVEILADMETPVSLLNKLYNNKGPIFLLESVEGGERWGRYSFLGTSAKSFIRVYKNFVQVEEDGKINDIPHNNQPLNILREIMSHYKAPDLIGLPRFWGGMVGYINYEMVSFFENIPNKWPENKPFASFIMPDEILIFDNIKNTLMIVAISYLDKEKNAEKAYSDALNKIQSILQRMDENSRTNNDNTVGNLKNNEVYEISPVIDEAEYRERVRKTKEYIYNGDIIQSVISQPFVCDKVPDLKRLYRAQRYVNPSPYLYFIHIDDVALVGSSPETMVRLENRIATLRPIAGTRPRGKSEQEDRSLANELLGDEKERAEHLMLVDLGRNDLGRVAETGTVQVTDLMIVERYSHVMHLVSNITCDIESHLDSFDLFKAVFPAGTLSGAPKIRAMEIIDELEKRPRGPYGGAVGYFSFNGNMDFAITIRTACIQDGNLVVRAGAGIVADSDPERERIETVNKAMAIQKALSLIEKRLYIEEDL